MATQNGTDDLDYLFGTDEDDILNGFGATIFSMVQVAMTNYWVVMVMTNYWVVMVMTNYLGVMVAIH
jgi:hypothetical protein